MSTTSLILFIATGGLFGLMLLLRRGGVSPAEAKRLVAGGARLLDVRSPGEFAAGALPGAINVPVGELASRIDRVGPKDRPVVVYCQSGGRSAHAKMILGKAGFTQVHNLGAMSRWG